MVRPSVVVADGDGRRVVVGDAQRPMVRVIGEDDSAVAELVDQGCCINRTGHLGTTRFPPPVLAELARRMPMAARCGRIWSSRT